MLPASQKYFLRSVPLFFLLITVHADKLSPAVIHPDPRGAGTGPAVPGTFATPGCLALPVRPGAALLDPLDPTQPGIWRKGIGRISRRRAYSLRQKGWPGAPAIERPVSRGSDNPSVLYVQDIPPTPGPDSVRSPHNLAPGLREKGRAFPQMAALGCYDCRAWAKALAPARTSHASGFHQTSRP